MQSKPTNQVQKTAIKKAPVSPRTVGHDTEIRNWMLIKSKKSHLSGDLFPLQSVLIPPRLLARIQTPRLDDPQQYVPVLFQTLPKLFDNPELLSGLPYPTVPLEKALSGSGRVVVTGYSGAGKTTVLADLVARICQKDPSAASFSGSLPIFIHCRDLELSVPLHGDVLAPLAHTVAVLLKHHEEKPVFDSIYAYAREGNLILFLDGLEEVLPDFKNQVTHWIKNLLNEHPRTRIITTGVPNYIGPLSEYGFFEFCVAPWTSLQKQEFITKFNTAWSTCFKPNESSQFIPLWLRSAKLPASPLDMTLLSWSAFTGNHASSEGLEIFSAYLEYAVPHPLSFETLTTIASKQISNGFSGLSLYDLENIVSKDPVFSKEIPEALRKPLVVKEKELGKTPEPLTAKTIIAEMLEAGVLTQSITGQISITNIHLCSALYARGQAPKLPNSWLPANQSAFVDSIMVFACSEGKLNDRLTKWLDEADLPLFRNVQMISHWLTSFPEANKANLQVLFRKVVPYIQKGRFPLSHQILLIEGFLLSGDPAALSLLKNLSSSPNASHRQLAAFGLSFVSSQEAEKLLINLSLDSSPEVQKLACISLAKLWSHNAQKQLVNLVISAAPEIRQLIAELLAFNSVDGHELLKELSVLPDNPETRKAAIYGLFLVGAEWSKAQIGKINIEDSEWLVRDASAHTISVVNLDYLLIPKPRPKPASQSWLIKFAAKKRMGMQADEFPVDILMLALKEGDINTQVAAIETLSSDNTEATLHLFKDIFVKTQGPLQEAAYVALLALAKRGLNIQK